MMPMDHLRARGGAAGGAQSRGGTFHRTAQIRLSSWQQTNGLAQDFGGGKGGEKKGGVRSLVVRFWVMHSQQQFSRSADSCIDRGVDRSLPDRRATVTWLEARLTVQAQFGNRC